MKTCTPRPILGPPRPGLPSPPLLRRGGGRLDVRAGGGHVAALVDVLVLVAALVAALVDVVLAAVVLVVVLVVGDRGLLAAGLAIILADLVELLLCHLGVVVQRLGVIEGGAVLVHQSELLALEAVWVGQRDEALVRRAVGAGRRGELVVLADGDGGLGLSAGLGVAAAGLGGAELGRGGGVRGQEEGKGDGVLHGDSVRDVRGVAFLGGRGVGGGDVSRIVSG